MTITINQISKGLQIMCSHRKKCFLHAYFSGRSWLTIGNKMDLKRLVTTDLGSLKQSTYNSLKTFSQNGGKGNGPEVF